MFKSHLFLAFAAYSPHLARIVQLVLPRKLQRERECAYCFISLVFPGSLWNKPKTGIAMVCFQTDIYRVQFLHLLLPLSEVCTWQETCISGMCVPLPWKEQLILFGSETCEEDTSMYCMNHVKLGSLMLSSSSSVKTSRAEYVIRVSCDSSQSLQESIRSFTSTHAAFYNFPATHKSRSVFSQCCFSGLFSVSFASPACLYLKLMYMRERWSRQITSRRKLVDLATRSVGVACTVARSLTPDFPGLIWLWNDQADTIWLDT